MRYPDKPVTVLKEYLIKTGRAKFFQHPLFIPISLFSLAFYIRYQFLNPFLYSNNFKKYIWIAEELLKGENIGERILDFSPLYTYLNVMFQYLFLGNNLFIILFQIILGSINCVLIYLIGQKLFSRSVGIAAGIIIAFYKNIILYEFILEPITVVLFLNSITILTLLFMSDNITKKSTLTDILKSCYIAGIFLGLGIITRPNILLFAPFALFWIFQCNKKAHGRLKHLGLYYLLFSIGILTSISPILIRNYKAFHKFSPAVMSPGQVFHQGNSINATGLNIYYPPLFTKIDIYKSKSADSIHELYREIARYSMGKEISAEESSRLWIEKAVNYIKAYPFEYLKLLINKFISFFNSYEMHDMAFAYKVQPILSDFPLLSFFLLMPLSLLGIFNMYYKRNVSLNAPLYEAPHPSFVKGERGIGGGPNFLLLSIILIYFLSNLIFFITSRQRLPVIPFLAIFSAYFIILLWKQVKDKKHKKLFVSFSFLVILLIFSSFPFKIISNASKEKTRSNQTFIIHNSKFREYLDNNNPALASREIKTAIAKYPSAWEDIGEGDIFYGDEGLIKGAIRIAENLYPPKLRDRYDDYHLGYLYILGKEYDKAETIFRKLNNHTMLGNIYFEKGMADKAINFFEEALENKEFDLAALTLLAAIYEKKGLEEKSIALIHHLKKFYDDVSLSFNLGSAYFKTGMVEKAITEWKKTADFFSKYPTVHSYLSKAYAKMGSLDKAYEAFETAIKIVPGLYVESKELEMLLGKKLKNNPEDLKNYSRLGTLYMKRGAFKKALLLYQQIPNPLLDNSKLDNTLVRKIEANYPIHLIYYGIGDDYLLSKDIELATRYFEKAKFFNYSKPELFLKLGHCYEKKEMINKAIRNYQNFLSMREGAADVYKIVGSLHYKKGAYFNAADHYHKCINYNSKDADCYFNLGIAYFQMNVLPKALENYIKAIELKPDEKDFHYNLGLVYKKMGEKEKANKEFSLAKRQA